MGSPIRKYVFHLFWMSFMSKTLPFFSKFLHLCKIGPILLLILLGGYRGYPRHNIHSGRLLWDPRFENTCFTCFEWVSCRKHYVIFRNFDISAKSVLYCYWFSWGATEGIQDIISTVEDFCGIPIWKHVFHCFEWVSWRKHYLVFRNSYISSKSVVYCHWFSGGLQSVSKT